MTTLRIIGTASTISAQLAAIQKLHAFNNGPDIKWDGRDDHHQDYLAPPNLVDEWVKI